MSVKWIAAALTMALATTTCAMPSESAGDEKGSQSATTVTWSVTSKTDPMTDETAVVAVARVQSRVVGTYEIQLSLLGEALSIRYTLFDAEPLNILFGTGTPRKIVRWRFDKSPATGVSLRQDGAFSNVFHGIYLALPFASAQSLVIQGLRGDDEYLTFSLGSSFEPMRQQVRKQIAAANAIENARVAEAAALSLERERRSLEIKVANERALSPFLQVVPGMTIDDLEIGFGTPIDITDPGDGAGLRVIYKVKGLRGESVKALGMLSFVRGSL